MRYSVFFLLIFLISWDAFSQGNHKPQIKGQQDLSTNEDESITILMTDLEVEDRDDWFYPWGFTMTVYPGSDYAVASHTVTPAEDFSGKLKVQVTVNDGQDESNKFDLEIDVIPVNDKPVITGHQAVKANESQAVSIQTGHLTVDDPDNKYPDDFTLKVLAGNNYTVDGNNVIPQAGFSGTLTVNVVVNDGQLDSDSYGLPVEVKPVDRVPLITGQSALQVNEDESITVLHTHLIVSDQDSSYPQGFTINISSGTNYTFTGTTVTPSRDFFGKLSVPVTVSDGQNTSKPFNLVISVTPVNDAPLVADLEPEPLFYSAGDSAIAVTGTITVKDVDGDSIMFAEVGFRGEGYQRSADKLVYSPPGNSNIRAVFDPDTGVLTLLGQASPASYSAALRDVSFETIAPSPVSKVLYFLVNDGKTTSEVVERSLLFGQPSVSLDIPTGFTPNGDFANDTWKIVPLKSEETYAHARIRIYNRHGVLVYESIGFESEWDGRLNGELLPADTYFYTIDMNTNTPEGYLKGVVTILR